MSGVKSENHAANKGKTAGRYQFDMHPTGIGLMWVLYFNYYFLHVKYEI